LLAPSLTALGGGVELQTRQLLEAIAAVWPEWRLAAALGHERPLAEPALISATLERRLLLGGSDHPRRTQRLARFFAHALALAVRTRPTRVLFTHAHYAEPAWMLARLFGAELFGVAHGIEVWQLEGRLRRRALTAARLLAVSQHTAERLRSLGPFRRGVSVVNNAVDPRRFFPGAPAAAVEAKLRDLPRPRLLTVARLDERERYKGIDVVLEALARRPGLAGSYLVVGEGSDRARLQARAEAARVPVRFHGHAPAAELADLYRACDLFVMPSRGEGFGYVFIEALACGLPAVGGNLDGTVDALDQGRLGLLVDPRDADAVGSAIARALTDERWRDPARLHAATVARFGPAAFRRGVRAWLETA
jgi:glycosyltransferase involved in cell wall biosynthesis